MFEAIVETNEPGIQMESVITECRNPKCRKKLRITVKLARKQAIHCTACQVDFQLNNETIDQLIQDAQQVTTYPPIELQVGKSGQSESTSVEPQSVQTPKTTRWGQSRSTLASKIRRFKQSEWYLVMVDRKSVV